MAKTLIGQLIFRLRTEGLGEAQKVTNAMRQVENAARRLGSAGVGSWGVGFQRQLDKLKLSAQEMKEVERSWIHLHDTMKSRSMADALQKNSIAHWKTNTVSVLAQGRAEMDRHFQEAEKSARSHANRMRDILKPGLAMLGAYTAPYLIGSLSSEALSASSERRREIFRQRMAGIPEKDRGQLFDRSEELGKKYPSIPITGIMEMSRSAYSVMGNTERANAILEKMVESLVVMQSARGPDAAGQQLIGLIRGLDNLGVNKDGPSGIDDVMKMIDAATRAAQVDPDFDPATFFEFAKSTKTAGPALSLDFLARAPTYIQDGTSGNALAMAFRAFALEAVGSAGGKKYLAERDRLGIRQNGKLVDGGMFGANPDEWVLKYLIPALQKDGVDLSDNTAVSVAIGKLSGNTTATGFITRIVTQRAQVERWLKMMDEAMGTGAAKDVRAEDPFVGWESFKKSLENLSAALTPIDTINAGLNSLANGINALSAVAKDNPALAALGMGVAGAGLYGGGKFALGALADVFGLKSSAIALDGSAAALTRAAIALGGSAVTDGTPDLKKGAKGGWGKLSGVAAVSVMGAWAMLTQAMGDTPGETFDDQVKNQRQYREFLERLFGIGNSTNPAGTPEVQSGLALDNARRSREAGLPASTDTMPGKTADDLDIGRGAIEASRAAGQEIQQNLSVMASPTVDTASMERALGIARALKNEIVSAGAAASRIDRNMGAEMRRNFADTSGGGGF
ncbi:hypothetical protein DEM27_06515 [Metarhizobium album]|uniref:Phage tail tape measure protein domain-containing protein n=1 Tax=Metarhizobium album TaxID=2182425 RepID=A0A2U2DVG3_9HYPH|nr:hypothetical protein [Rhizobium album]PWE57286.1 hypothetical protein DEM27_06515 [Rhizobium album]